jgi:acetylornithine deacetylase/succinyl-diaminopimelate desuccinylase-like protein
LARLLVEYEANPIEALLERGTPVYSMVECVGQHAKDLPRSLRTLIEQSLTSDTALRELQALLTTQPTYRSLIGTTQAITLMQGGVKVNSLPEEAWAVVNHRIATQRSVFHLHCRDSRCSSMSSSRDLRAALSPRSEIATHNSLNAWPRSLISLTPHLGH